MMQTKVVLVERHYVELRAYLFDRPGVEGAAFLLCGESRGAQVTKLASHAVVPIAEEDILRRERDGLSISSRALMRIAKLACYEKLSVVFAHSHPDGFADFSPQDNAEELKLLPFLQARVPGRLHGTLVLSNDAIVGRIYIPERCEVDHVVVIGSRLRIQARGATPQISERYDRQVRAFGAEIQAQLGRLHIGIVGLGGTGSAVAEQVYRLGVGRLSLFDGDVLAESNLNRVYGSKLCDVGRNKTAISKEHLDGIALGGNVIAVDQHITMLDAAQRLRECDVIFGCTDKELPRGILIQLALRYHIPVIDMGVLLASEQGKLRGVHGRVTTLMAGEACLFCRGRISAEAIRIEALTPEDRAVQVQQGYAPELDEPAPAVVPFTSAVASAAVAELLHRLTGFMGSARESSEVLLMLDENRVRANRVEPLEDCQCSEQALWGRGDEDPFLSIVWPTRR